MPDTKGSSEQGYETIRADARRAVLSANHKDCDPTTCYRASEVDTLLIALAEAGYTLVLHTRSEDGDGRPLDYCAACFMDWPCSHAPHAKASYQTPEATRHP